MNLLYVIVVVGLLTVTPWTVALQAPLSMKFSRQECWSGLPFAPPGDLPDPGIEPKSPVLQSDSLPLEPSGKHQGCFMHASHFIPQNVRNLLKG